MTDQAAARHNMVESQLKPNRVTDLRVQAAMATIPRERFVPEHLSHVAYVDEDLELVPGRYLMEPRVFGRLLQEAVLREGERVLEVGCGTGFGLAVLADMGAVAVGLESDPVLAAAARSNLKALGVAAEIVQGDLTKGVPGAASFDVMLISGMIADLPEALAAQVRMGGRILAIIGQGPVGEATLFTRAPGSVSGRALFDAGVPALPGFARAPGFVF